MNSLLFLCVPSFYFQLAVYLSSYYTDDCRFSWPFFVCVHFFAACRSQNPSFSATPLQSSMLFSTFSAFSRTAGRKFFFQPIGLRQLSNGKPNGGDISNVVATRVVQDIDKHIRRSHYRILYLMNKGNTSRVQTEEQLVDMLSKCRDFVLRK